MMYGLNKRKRRHERHDVYWEALLEIETSSFQKHIPVPLINMSQSGALLCTGEIAYNNYHLAVAGHNDELNLIIHTPTKAFDSKIVLKRYRWVGDMSAFEIGVEFKNTYEKNREFTTWLVENIENHLQPKKVIEEQGDILQH